MEKLFSKIKKETLNKDEKTKILSALQIFADENPIRNVEPQFYNPWLVFLRRKAFIIPAVAVIVVVSMTGSAVLAAKNSLPGNILYPVKLLNEKVQSVTAVGPEAQAQIHVSQAISRLQEVEQLVNTNVPISTSTKREIQNRFGTQAQEVMRSVNELKNSGQTEEAAKIQSDFKSSIAEHKKAIIELSTGDDNEAMLKINSQLERSDTEYKRPQGEVRGTEKSGSAGSKSADN